MDPAAYLLSSWDAATPDERDERARALLERLPESFTYRGLERCDSFGHARWIAGFVDDFGHDFALVPGGMARLGHDPRRNPLQLTDDDRESYAFSRSGFALPALDEYLAELLSEPRERVLSPFLLEVRGKPLDTLLESILAEDDAFPSTFTGLIELLAARGMRLPDEDEWEWAASGGADTIFLWGDQLRAGSREVDDARNAFGIVFPTGFPELTADPSILRGGDDGSLICGGVGRIPVTLLRSPRRRERSLLKTRRTSASNLRYDAEVHIRRLVPLDPLNC